MLRTSPNMQTFGKLSPKGAIVHKREIVIIRVYFLHPLLFYCLHTGPVEIAPFDRFSFFIAQKTCFGDSYDPFGVRTKMF